MKVIALVLLLIAKAAHAESWDNEAGIYALAPLPDAATEALRLDTDEREDQQPLGRMVRAGDQLTLDLPDLPDDVTADLMIGFRPLWAASQDQQADRLGLGRTTVTALQDGPIFLRLTGGGPDVAVRLTGGTPIPLYVDGAMTAADWQAELTRHKGAAFVQLIGPRVLITLTRDAYGRDPVPDPGASLGMIDQVLALEDDLSGLDNSNPLNSPTPLRQHFIVDFLASAADQQQFYMYATDGFIGLLPDNSGDLTNPAILPQAWGIWHELGHIHQQNSWTWGSATEITVNIWSLYVQEAFGNPNRLSETDGTDKPVLAQARDYIGAGGGAPDFLIDDSDTLFVRLTMFHQLRLAYGWDLFRQLNQATRAAPLPADATDQDKIDYFVREICRLTGHDLRGFFDRWGLMASDKALSDISAMNLPAPKTDPAQLF